MPLTDDKSLLRRQYIEDVTIFESGDEAVEAYVIEEGGVQIYRKEDGVRHDLATLGPGDIFGEMALIKKSNRTSFAVATERTVVAIVTKELLEEKMQNSDPLIKALVHLLVKRLYRSNDEKQGKTA